jgi:hypothetical protein
MLWVHHCTKSLTIKKINKLQNLGSALISISLKVSRFMPILNNKALTASAEALDNAMSIIRFKRKN